MAGDPIIIEEWLGSGHTNAIGSEGEVECLTPEDT